MDPFSVTAGTIGVVGVVIQVYSAVEAAYDLYLGVQDFTDTYGKIRTALLIERYRLELFKDEVLAIPEEEKRRIQHSPRDRAFWKLFEFIFNKILETFNKNSEIMERYGNKTGLPEQKDGSDWDLIDNLTLSLKSPPKHTLSRIKHSMKFLTRNKSKLEETVKDLKYWNDSLDSMTSKLIQESNRRRLRTRLTTNNLSTLENVAAAAAMLEHWDIERMASARTLIENITQNQPVELVERRTRQLPEPPTEHQFEMEQFTFQGNPFPSDINRATAFFKGEKVIIDWRCCEDDSWRLDNPRAFRQRTEALTKILNSDLRPLNLSILHCLGYFDQSKNITGYAFRPPPNAGPDDKPISLQEAIRKTKSAEDVPDLGDRFELAKALASTIFEIHNLGWIHKNIQPTNILFWPKVGSSNEVCVNKPYLMGFDISRPNQPGEITEKPPFRAEDDVYRHPHYKDRNALAFRPSFDIHSLGVVLWEIGLWGKIGATRPRSSSSTKDYPQPTDRDFIEKMIAEGEINKLKRMTGTRYRDAVLACFSRDLDILWKGTNMRDREQKLRSHLDLVRQQVVDVLASCSA